MHLTLSEFTGVEELQIEKSEADDLSEALKEYGKFKGMHFDPEKVALFNLCVALGRVYIPRGIAIKNRAKLKETVAQPKPELVKPKTNGAPAPPTKIHLGEKSPSEIFGFESAEI